MKIPAKMHLSIICFLILLLIMAAGCSKEKNEQGFKVYPVPNNQAANSYIISDEREAAVIDPSDPERIDAILNQKGLKPNFIILTHGHFDHIMGLDSLVNRYPGIKVMVHQADSGKLSDPEKNVSTMFGMPIKSTAKSFPVREKDIIKIGNTEIKVIETPGHTEGSIILLAGNSLFSGDTLFKGSVGRTDFPGSSRNDLDESLKKIISLPDNLQVYPGHGETTILKEEKETNPYLKELD